MKRVIFLLALVLAISVGVGLVRRADLRELRAEAKGLQLATSQGSRPPSLSGGGEERRSRVREEASSPADIEGARAMIGRMLELMKESAHSSDIDLGNQIFQIRSSLVAILRPMDQKSLRECLEVVKSDPGLSGDVERQVLFLLVTCMLPERAMALVADTPDLDRKSLLPDIFRQWCREDPDAAVKWYEEEEGKANSGLLEPAMLGPLLEAEARIDPDRAVKRAMEASPSEQDNLGPLMIGGLSDEQEHGSFLAALRRAETATPGDHGLKRIRDHYVVNLPGVLSEWTFDDATGLMDGEFTAEEKQLAARNLAANGGIQEKEKWAGWFQQMGNDLEPSSPVRIFQVTWMHSDTAAAGKWLENYPAGKAKDQMTAFYAGQMMSANPAEARRWVERLPEGESRDLLEKRLRDREK